MRWYQTLKRGRAVLPFALAGFMLACAASNVRAETDRDTGIRVSDAWVRSTAPGAEVGAAYAALHNESGHALLVSDVSSDVSRSAELHEMSTHGGIVRMRHLDRGLSVKAGETARLEPGGMHLMLIGLGRPLRVGDSVLLHFRISDGRQISVAAPVRESAP